MGIENRDYVGDSYSEYGGGGSFLRGQSGGGQIWKKIIIGTVIVFVLQIVTSQEAFSVTEWLQLSPDKVVYKGQVWRLLTYAFCHSQYDILHLVFNMLFVWWFGKTIEQMYGSREFLVFYLTSAVVAGLAFVGIAFATGDPTPSVGASGAVMAFLMVYTMHFPRQKIYIWGIIPIELRWLMTFYVIFDLYPVLQTLTSGGGRDGIAHSAHLGGLLFGYLYYRNQWRISNWFSGLKGFKWEKKRRVPKGVRLHDPDRDKPVSRKSAKADDAWEQDVDRILAKIHEQGEASLTGKERKILKKASDRYKNKT